MHSAMACSDAVVDRMAAMVSKKEKKATARFMWQARQLKSRYLHRGRFLGERGKDVLLFPEAIVKFSRFLEEAAPESSPL